MSKAEKTLLVIALSILVIGMWVNLASIYAKSNCAMYLYQGGVMKTFLNLMMFWNNYCEPNKLLFFVV